MNRAQYGDVMEWFSLDRYDYVLDLSVNHVVPGQSHRRLTETENEHRKKQINF